jgi:hypothetical protein
MLTLGTSFINAYLSSIIKSASSTKKPLMVLATGCTSDGTTANRRNKKRMVHWLYVVSGSMSFGQSGPHKCKNKQNHCHVSQPYHYQYCSNEHGFLGQSRNQALHAINDILVLEKSLTQLNEKVNSLELQLMGDAILDGTDITQQVEELCAHHI